MRILDCSQIGLIMTLPDSENQNSGGAFEMDVEVWPGAINMPLHCHPFSREIFEIKSGKLEIFRDGRWLSATPGYTITIEKGEPHTFKNTSSGIVQMINIHEPAMGFKEYFHGLHKFANSGIVKNQTLTLKSILGLATLWNNYPVEIRSVNPPPVLMKSLISG